MTSISSIRSLEVELPPSCIVFCPAYPQYFVVGTYFSHTKSEDEAESSLSSSAGEGEAQKRTGSSVSYKVEGDDVTPVATIPIASAILDIQFSPHDPSLLGVATSTGSLSLYTLSMSPSSPHPTLTPKSTHPLFPTTTLTLSLAWHPTNPSSIGVTASDGGVYTVSLSHPKDEPRSSSQHDLEAWTLAFAPRGWGPRPSEDEGGGGGEAREAGNGATGAVLSGGDDAALRFRDSTAGVQWADRKVHGAGVTAISPLPLPLPLASSSSSSGESGDSDSLVVTGSYDDQIRSVRTPRTGRRPVLAELDSGGGVWRLKFLTVAQEASERGRWVILASCMHAGARIVELNRDEGGEWGFEVSARFEEHQSMNYGSDVQPGTGDGDGDGRNVTIVSTSFYDKLSCSWRYGIA